MRKIHPKFVESDDEDFIYRTESEENDKSEEEEKSDPRWDALKKLKFKK